MLLYFDDYTKEYPRRPVSELKKFESCPKALHEMTLTEVNEIVKDFQPVLRNTALRARRIIAQYFDWLSEKGVQVSLDAKGIEFPITSEMEHYVYNSNDIHQYFVILDNAIKEHDALIGATTSHEALLMTHAAGILAFYGLTDEQILNLDLKDVLPTGVVGFDLPLSKDDMAVLMEYKGMDKFANGLPLLGTKYIRTTYSYNTEIEDPRFLSRPLVRLNISKEYNYLKDLLKPTTLNLMGKFDRAFRYEKENGEEIKMNITTPQWFGKIMQLKGSWLAERKKDYIAYRNIRNSL